MREIVLDTETTGLNAKGGDRIVEVGCVELLNHLPTGHTFQRYVNPERPMPTEAEAVHGLGDAFLADKPVFAAIADEFVNFLADSRLIIHNADFDIGFINAELERLGRPAIPMDNVVDTVKMARARFPGARVNLDSLCQRFQIDLSNRQLHGALLDSRLLAEVYLELLGGRQPGLALAKAETGTTAATLTRTARPPRSHAPTAEEEAAHAAFMEKIENPVWLASES